MLPEVHRRRLESNRPALDSRGRPLQLLPTVTGLPRTFKARSAYRQPHLPPTPGVLTRAHLRKQRGWHRMTGGASGCIRDAGLRWKEGHGDPGAEVSGKSWATSCLMRGLSGKSTKGSPGTAPR